MSAKVAVTCVACGVTFMRFPSQLRGKGIKYGPFCNRDCLGKYRSEKLTGSLAANFRGGSKRDRSYFSVLAPWHPFADRGYVYLHRLIAEAHLGRFLRPDEVVHHKDHNPENNHWANLQVMTQSEHFRLHRQEEMAS